jgi:hypothetical protein
LACAGAHITAISGGVALPLPVTIALLLYFAEVTAAIAAFAVTIVALLVFFDHAVATNGTWPAPTRTGTCRRNSQKNTQTHQSGSGKKVGAMHTTILVVFVPKSSAKPGFCVL